MLDWLVKRLTPYKAREPRWVSLASSVQQVWETTFDPALSRLERLRSYYQADKRDLQRLIREMGDYFADELPNDADLPIAVSWRRMELEYKDLELILSSVFRRHFGNLAVTWFPMFAPLHEPYGVGFKAADGPWPELKNIPPDGMFLTSRGRLGIDYGGLLKTGMSKAEFLEKGIPLLQRTKPLHIVYDGPLWYIYFDLPFHLDLCDRRLRHEKEWHGVELHFSTIGGRYDFTTGDVCPVDNTSLDYASKTQSHWTLHFIDPDDQLWRLDERMPDFFMAPGLDMSIPGHEGERTRPFSLLYSLTDAHFTLSASASVSGGQAVSEAHSFELPFSTIGGRYDFTTGDVRPMDNSSLDCTDETADIFHLTFNGPERRSLDLGPLFDDIPADYMPLDTHLGGCAHA